MLITGASAGIGEGLAREFARRGYGLAIAARRLDRLEALAPQLLAAGAAQVVTIALDVADTDAIEPAVQRAAAELGRLDVIVANAGVGPLTPTGRGKLPLMRETLNINLVGAIATIEAALPIFRAQGSGQVVGVTSVAGSKGLPGFGAYSASKAGLHRYLQSLRAELRGTPVVVTELAPGFIDTDINRDKGARPFLIDVDKGAAIMARMIERQVGKRWVPVLPWTIIAQLLKILPAALTRAATEAPLTEDTTMDFEHSPRVKDLQARLTAFMDDHVYPNEARFFAEVEANKARGNGWVPTRVMEEMKARARAAGLWNLWLPESEHGAGLTNLEYAPLAELTGRSHIAPEALNCAAPDTGNMEVLVRYGNDEQRERWLKPLLAGEIRSGFAMTEPAVASSDATNISASIVRDGDHYVINGRKWWTSGASDPRCKVLIFMGKTDPSNPSVHRQQSMILVPMDTPGVRVVRPVPVFGYLDEPHGHPEVDFENVRVPVSNLLLGEGRGFEIAQGRLGPGRIHHCMRIIGATERALEAMCRRSLQRTAFHRKLAEQGVWRERIADARMKLDQARLLTLHAAWKMDVAGNKAAQKEIAMIKVVAPNVACEVIDQAIQLFGGAGVTDDHGLGWAYAMARTLRIADGPDEVHRNHIAKLELSRYLAA